jgi:hypothetical protein
LGVASVGARFINTLVCRPKERSNVPHGRKNQRNPPSSWPSNATYVTLSGTRRNLDHWLRKGRPRYLSVATEVSLKMTRDVVPHYLVVQQYVHSGSRLVATHSSHVRDPMMKLRHPFSIMVRLRAHTQAPGLAYHHPTMFAREWCPFSHESSHIHSHAGEVA